MMKVQLCHLLGESVHGGGYAPHALLARNFWLYLETRPMEGSSTCRVEVAMHRTKAEEGHF